MRRCASAILALFLLAAPVWADDGLTEWTTTRSGNIEFSARLVYDVDRIEQMLGDSLDKSFTLVEIKILPLYDQMLELEREDFLFRCRCDNERSTAQSPERIAGSAVLALGQEKTGGGGGVFGQNNDPLIIGGVPGTGTRPRRLPGQGGGVGGATGGGSTETTVQGKTTETGSLLDRLKALEIPLDPIDEQISGYLFFQVQPNRKLKHYVLSYDGVYGEFQMLFDK